MNPIGPVSTARRLWRPLALYLYAASGLLVAAAFLAKSPVPLFAALPLLLAPASGLALAPSSALGARLTWAAEGSGAEVTLRGTIAAEGRVDVRRLEVRFYTVEPLEPVAPPKLELRGGEIRFEAKYRAPYPCLLIVPRPDVLWVDPLGLLEVPVRVAGDALRVERFPPEVSNIGRSRLERTTSAPGEIRSRAIGPAGEFFAVRTAAPTDTYRQINWWATARGGRLLANDYHLERTGDLVILLDLRPTSLGPEKDRQLLAVSRAAALGIASSFLSQKARVGLGLFDEFLTAVPLGSGRLQQFRLQVALQKAEIAITPGPAERLGVSMRRYFPPGVTTLLISPLADEEGLLVLPHLRRRGFPAIVLSPSPLPMLSASPSDDRGEAALAGRLLRIVRRVRVGEGWREASVIEWEDYWSLAPLVDFLARPVLRRNR
ncbi:MAG: DUF58 domain-containing protein [Thermoplasmata archaeon]|nr:DUF58 domain-containing protein [Thermoplasmata archaeon]